MVKGLPKSVSGKVFFKKNTSIFSLYICVCGFCYSSHYWPFLLSSWHLCVSSDTVLVLRVHLPKMLQVSCHSSVFCYLLFSLSVWSTVVLFQTVSMTFCDSSFCLLRPLRQNGLPPPFPGETVPLFLYLLTCVVAGLQRTPTLPFLLSAPLSTNFIEFEIAAMGTCFHTFLFT